MSKKIDYLDQYKDPRWQKKRLEILERDQWMCQVCGDDGSELNVHHKIYFKDKKVWEYDNEYLETLCDKCHSEAHLTKIKIEKLMAHIPSMFLDNYENYIRVALRFDPGRLDLIAEFLEKLFPYSHKHDI
jgi:hypothetical protein